MAHGVFHKRLHHECRHHHAFQARLDIDVNGKAVFAEPRHFEREVTHRLLDLARQLEQIVGILECAAIEHGELAQQHAGAIGVGAHERRDGVDGVEQEVRVDLALERLELHGGRELRLLLQLNGGNLRRKQLTQALCERHLRFGDVARAAIVKLQRADNGVASRKRHDNARSQAFDAIGEANLLRRAQHAQLAVFKRGMRSLRANGGATGADFLVVSGIAQNRLAVGDCHGLRSNGGQQQMAHLLRRGNVEALLEARKRLRRDFQNRIGLASAHRVGIKAQIDEQRHGNGERNARDNIQIAHRFGPSHRARKHCGRKHAYCRKHDIEHARINISGWFGHEIPFIR